MNADDIRRAQHDSWNKFSPGWRKWDAQTMAFLAPQRDVMVEHLRPHATATVLDIAAGTGEPGLSLARRAAGGRVVMTDLSEGMLGVARDKAAVAGVGNVEFRTADACNLPFADASFDFVSCRLGFMFFPDMAQAAAEMMRVLRPGGRFATTVWRGPEANYWVTCMQQNIKKHIEVPPPEPGAPGMFRCAAPGLVAGLFRAAGAGEAKEVAVPSKLACGSAEGYWSMITEISAPFVAALASASPATVANVRAGVLADMHARHPDGIIDACATAILGVK